MKWFVKEKTGIPSPFNAGSKARLDVEKILSNMCFKPIEVSSLWEADERRKAKGVISILYRIKAYNCWKSLLDIVESKDILLIQLPIELWTEMDFLIYKKLKEQGVILIGLVHDIGSMRINTKSLVRLRHRKKTNDEIRFLHYFDYIVVPNEISKRYFVDRLKCDKNIVKVLRIYDYLLDNNQNNCSANKKGPIIIAGNLSHEKAGYIYSSLPSEIDFSLYGDNYSGHTTPNITYNGKFSPEELPIIIKGSFGLVWDGNSTETCDGCYGEYMRYNSPHKLSLYLVAGLPIIIWSEAAMARFVIENNCGFVIDSLSELHKKIESITPEQYDLYVENALRLKELLSTGFFTREALSFVNE